ncbi:ribulose-phosphate 3-epimerase [Actinomyces sp. 2119]|uniref:Ribulose-phosphate 3-epimerase n=1 Tax=Actinomyces lilanjuaniae TaxID=2321394 RepID=A0ABN5PQ15_9ACTO|nr:MULTISPECIES: ribulose-phosphate 3-epimerase [Actinomyces]AYD89778.1 ribulose-phosphate 3-epimerase [Actinomyces lilanjuaniae]RJF44752.1 ribulose-phosphate 3-epimerase [Actinomyces sp. 2119]
MRSPAIHPSILNCDIAHLADELARVSSADGVHVDVMDNHFVPNLSWGMPVVEAVLATTSLPVDAHLMIEDPDRWAPAYAESGCDVVTVHAEAAAAPVRLAHELHRLGARAGLALRPATSVEAVADVVQDFDLLLVMTVEPGFGGQRFLEPMLAKIERARRLVGSAGIRLQVDGGITPQTIERAAEAGAEVFVAGSAVYRAQDAQAAISELRSLAGRHCC